MNSNDLVLVGGGHTHALLIRALSMRPIHGVRVTLISDKTLTPYSGMLPGFVAGHYSYDETNIDLNQLCRRAGVRWIKGRVNSINAEGKIISLVDQAAVSYDVLSVDIGSTPDLSINGARQFALGVKPITNFQSRWSALLEESTSDLANQAGELKGDWGVIGAGAGGVELVLAMAYRMKHCSNLRFHLVFRGAVLLPGYPSKVVSKVEKKLKEYGVTLHSNFSVTEVTAGGVTSEAGDKLDLTESIWCTGALGAGWLGSSGIAITDKNFIRVNPYLQSTSHSAIFAVGDIAEMIEDPRPKAGVYAVRQAPFLEENIRRLFLNQPLKQVNLQSEFLSLLSLGDREAVASRNGLALKGQWVWRWKDYIDQKFMRQFAELQPSMSAMISGQSPAINDEPAMHCGGCGSKLGPDILEKNLSLIAESSADRAESAMLNAIAEDASIWRPSDGAMMVQSTDGFRSFTDDEYQFGRICVSHALSDIYAMGANATHVQSWINLQFSHPKLQQRDHLRLLRGIVDALDEQGAQLSGGHSTEGVESHLAIVANGEVRSGEQWLKSGVQDGDVLLLSKSLGIGVVLAADMQGQAPATAVDAAFECMALSNQNSMLQLIHYSPHAVTDVTGFGLIGHLLEMLDAAEATSDTRLEAIIDLPVVPFITGAQDLARAGWRSSIFPHLQTYIDRCTLVDELAPDQSKDWSENEFSAEVELLLDPQTSGGLLACLSHDDAAQLLARQTDFVEIGRIQNKTGSTSIRLNSVITFDRSS